MKLLVSEIEASNALARCLDHVREENLALLSRVQHNLIVIVGHPKEVQAGLQIPVFA